MCIRDSVRGELQGCGGGVLGGGSLDHLNSLLRSEYGRLLNIYYNIVQSVVQTFSICLI